ncbi:uncharacterized protein LOC116198889 isoform X2 [Punica granatum]|uniref:Uncharacterized protein LOC116198889 isoform X2 n=1 Tax=Punica granatum TaxID=22663 RepID=A0A218Y2N9_PUNGR|nr:uncharacterized protein LOC116198889 isoform X2 [Punica granatum]XP_031385013.1 uncharacterized protein LOC116198889 isoform X2 [Punica granatum]OWM91454.1 hypothetical protein CDL15_Pgr017372 [Punica granatum]
MTSSSPNLSASSVSKNLVMEAERPVSRIDRKSSIESEPRTLSLRQMERAREAALIVLNTRSIEDAMSIFTEAHSREGGDVRSASKKRGGATASTIGGVLATSRVG